MNKNEMNNPCPVCGSLDREIKVEDHLNLNIKDRIMELKKEKEYIIYEKIDKKDSRKGIIKYLIKIVAWIFSLIWVPVSIVMAIWDYIIGPVKNKDKEKRVKTIIKETETIKYRYPDDE